jgi:hypothetical protein
MNDVDLLLKSQYQIKISTTIVSHPRARVALKQLNQLCHANPDHQLAHDWSLKIKHLNRPIREWPKLLIFKAQTAGMHRTRCLDHTEKRERHQFYARA